MPVQSKPRCFNRTVLRSVNKPPDPDVLKSNNNKSEKGPPVPQAIAAAPQPSVKEAKTPPPKKENIASALDPDEEKKRKKNLRNHRRRQRKELRLHASESGLPSPRFLPNSTTLVSKTHPHPVEKTEFKTVGSNIPEVAEELDAALYVYVRPPDSDVSMLDVRDDDFEDTFVSANEAQPTNSSERRSPTKSPRPTVATENATPTSTPRRNAPADSAAPTKTTTPPTGSAAIQLPFTLARDTRRRIREMKQLSIALARSLSCFERDFIFMGLNPGVAKTSRPRKGAFRHRIIRKWLLSSVRRRYL